YEAGDKRREANFLVGPQLDFGGSAALDFAADDPDLQLNYTPNISELEPNSVRESGARMKKFSYQLFGRPEMNNDYPVMRLGQVHLIRAEARSRAAGDWSLSLPDINAIRDRAGVAPLASIDAQGFFDERGREMFQESSRRTDQIRFGKFTSETWWEKTNTDAFRDLFPIPQAQIDAAGGSLTQNPGY
ncbi:MAG: RagB/SusD family nutrient uptake outer membrane protein, partial [Maribacter sp.]|nr:RagB/SusD family nutrient uptake outer membrane protein [Maribacter sp.]